ncbi:hypothetical protein UY3_11744 [Chelonia mydas]|uniref:Uncharacterized protein n=1 Tax=Chelonia mydas TaxID=8469 RepID=M7B6G8_CHEMY|nr:hypothetical protein UY3_11744 [Chelonia mydas]
MGVWSRCSEQGQCVEPRGPPAEEPDLLVASRAQRGARTDFLSELKLHSPRLLQTLLLNTQDSTVLYLELNFYL